MTNANHPSIGDYVLATKYDDGDPMDHWCVGFYAGPTDHTSQRHNVVDGDGKTFRGNGFRRIKTISPERGDWILKHAKLIELSGKSVWHFARCTMNEPELPTQPASDTPEDALIHACYNAITRPENQ